MFHQLTVSVAAAFALFAAPAAAAEQSPQAVLNELLATERGLSEAAAKLAPAEGIASLLASDGVLFTRPAPVTGRDAAVAALRANPANKGTFASWRSVRGGVSADGQHGFTIGYLEVDGGAPATARRRYLAYWVRGTEGWRVATMKQALQGADEKIVASQPPALPPRIVAANPGRTAAHTATLIAAEKSFSDRAQLVGNRQAFQEFGRQDAIHVFGPNSLTVGLKAIGESHDQQAAQQPKPPPQDPPPPPTTVNWSADTAIVASSGDLGVTLGKIRQNDPSAVLPPGAFPDGNPFFTIWRRDGVDQPWKYIAE